MFIVLLVVTGTVFVIGFRRSPTVNVHVPNVRTGKRT